MSKIIFEGLVDKRNIWLLFGCYCNNPKLITDDSYKTVREDFVDTFHIKIWGALNNIVKKSNVNKITAVEIENEMSSSKSSMDVWNVNKGFEWIESAIEETKDKIYNVSLYHDTVRKYSILRYTQNELKMDISFVYEEYDELDTFNPRLAELKLKMERFNEMTSKKLLGEIDLKYLAFKKIWNLSNEDNYSFHIGENITERLQEHKNQSNAWGYPFQSAYLTTIFRGMRPKKFMIRSSISGGGKSRSSMAEACNIACDKIYDWNKKEWISTGEKCPTLFISTELTKEEIQDCLLAHISGIDEDRISTWDVSEEEEKVLLESSKIVENSLLFGEYMPDFNIDLITDTIEFYILNEGITHAFFDYINDSPSLYSYYIEKTGVRLQTHQILFLFSAALKQVANKYNIYLGSATQVSSNWKEEKDANALKGSKAIIEKADYGVLSLPATPQDLKKLEKIINNGFYKQPNMAYYIFKNRGGKWKSIVVWTQLNLGTVREIDCFVTNENFELINNIEQTLIEFQLNDVGDVCTLIDGVSIKDATDYLSELNKVDLS